MRIMKTVFHASASRGHANHGWLDTYHTFSFSSYYNPERMHFGMLRVLNDDVVAGGMGFGTHPHDNMEIISIPLSGDLEHKDSMGNTQVIRENDVQIMTAGTGVFHSEKNKNHDKPVNFLQIWIYPNKRDVVPGYGQKNFSPEELSKDFTVVVSPEYDQDGLNIQQDAWLSLAKLKKGDKVKYSVKREGNGVYFFLIDGQLKVEGNELQRRDGIGVWETDAIELESISDDARVLVIDVPMK